MSIMIKSDAWLHISLTNLKSFANKHMHKQMVKRNHPHTHTITHTHTHPHTSTHTHLTLHLRDLLRKFILPGVGHLVEGTAAGILLAFLLVLNLSHTHTHTHTDTRTCTLMNICTH